MKKLATRDGFFKEYFLECKNHKSNKAAFNALNKEYNDLFGLDRYSDFESFKRVIIFHNQKK